MFGMNVMAWNGGDLEKLEVLQNRLRRLALGALKWTAAEALRGDLGWSLFSERMVKAVSNYKVKIERMENKRCKALSVNRHTWRWNEGNTRLCLQCNRGVEETVEHLVLECSQYEHERESLMDVVHEQYGENKWNARCVEEDSGSVSRANHEEKEFCPAKKQKQPAEEWPKSYSADTLIGRDNEPPTSATFNSVIRVQPVAKHVPPVGTVKNYGDIGGVNRSPGLGDQLSVTPVKASSTARARKASSRNSNSGVQVHKTVSFVLGDCPESIESPPATMTSLTPLLFTRRVIHPRSHHNRDVSLGTPLQLVSSEDGASVCSADLTLPLIAKEVLRRQTIAKVQLEVSDQSFS
ncbi:hypothetical protein FHG87_000087 [Trinorchestia longiramus]|nr:hypothetical protein FHG87_000087 [Trinorchestia longiramus]